MVKLTENHIASYIHRERGGGGGTFSVSAGPRSSALTFYNKGELTNYFINFVLILLFIVIHINGHVMLVYQTK